MKVFPNTMTSSHTQYLSLGTAVLAAVVIGTVALLSVYTSAASRAITGRAIIRPDVTSSEIPVDFIRTSPADSALDGARGKLIITGSTKIYRNTGTTSIGGVIKPVQSSRVTSGRLLRGQEISFKGTSVPGDPQSVRATMVSLHDRSFTVCGPLQGITRRSSANANENTLTLNVKKMTVQESRFGRFFPIGKDVLFTYGTSVQFHNANGSWKAPKNRVAVDVADITASQQSTVVRGKVTDTQTLEVTGADMGVKCQ